MKKLIVGVLVTLLGVFLLLNRMNLFEDWVYNVVISWPALLAALGLIFLFDRKEGHNMVGVFMLIVAAFFLVPRIWTSINLWGGLFPVLIIAAGVALILKAVRQKNVKNNFDSHHEWSGEDEWSKWYKGKYSKTSSFDSTTISGGVVRREYVFNGAKEKWTYGKLKNVAIDAVFSGVELDFTQTELADDIKIAAHIQVSSVFSGVTLYVPDDWNIMIQKNGVFGGFVDNRPRSAEQNVNKDKLVILELEAVFGGGEIRCYE